MKRSLASAALIAVAISMTPALPASAQAVQTVRYAEVDGMPLMMDVYRPPSGAGNGLGVLVIHGGRWMRGDRGDTPADLIAAQGFVAFSVDYRLAPEYPYPAAIQDLQQAVRYVRENAGDFGIDPAKIWAMGGSAGGHLAALLGTLGQGSTAEGARVAAVASWSGPMDLRLLAQTNLGLARAATQFVGCNRPEEPECAEALREASPVTHLDPSDPPMFIANGTAEPIPFDQAVVGARDAEEAGVEAVVWTVEGNVHGFSYVREVLPPTTAFVLNVVEGQDNPIDPPATPEISVPQVSPPATTEPSRDRAGGYTPPRRDQATSLPLVLGALALVAAAVLAAVVLARRGVGRGSW